MGFTGTQIKNNQPIPISLPHPFRGVLAPGVSFITRLPAERVKYLLSRNDGRLARELDIKDQPLMSGADALFSEHAPPIDEWIGTCVTADNIPTAVSFKGPAEYGGALRLIPKLAATYSITHIITARQTNEVDGASYRARHSIRTDGGGLIISGSFTLEYSDETTAAWNVTGAANVGESAPVLNVVGGSDATIVWQVRSTVDFVSF